MSILYLINIQKNILCAKWLRLPAVCTEYQLHKVDLGNWEIVLDRQSWIFEKLKRESFGNRVQSHLEPKVTPIFVVLISFVNHFWRVKRVSGVLKVNHRFIRSKIHWQCEGPNFVILKIYDRLGFQIARFSEDPDIELDVNMIQFIIFLWRCCYHVW